MQMRSRYHYRNIRAKLIPNSETSISPPISFLYRDYFSPLYCFSYLRPTSLLQLLILKVFKAMESLSNASSSAANPLPPSLKRTNQRVTLAEILISALAHMLSLYDLGIDLEINPVLTPPWPQPPWLHVNIFIIESIF